MDAVQWMGTPGYAGVMVRKYFHELMGPGGLYEKCVEMMKGIDGVRIVGGNKPEISIPHIGSRLMFRHMQNEMAKFNFQGAEFATIYVDEGTKLTSSQFWYLISRNRTVCGIDAYARLFCNPEPGWVADMLEWWLDDEGYARPDRSGVIRWFLRNEQGGFIWSDTKHHKDAMSFTFIHAGIKDNAYLRDTNYISKLSNLDLVDRERLLKGNWRIVETKGDHFRRGWCDVIYEETKGTVWARGWDKAATPDPKADFTASARIGRQESGRYILDLRSLTLMQEGPGHVLDKQAEMAKHDGIDTTVACWQDPAQGGLVDIYVTRQKLAQWNVSTVLAAGSRSKASWWKPFTVAAKRGDVDLLRSPGHKEPNVDQFLNMLEGAEGRDDAFDAVAVGFQIIHEAPQYDHERAALVSFKEKNFF